MSASHQAKDVGLGGQGDLPASRTSPHLVYPTLCQWAGPGPQRGFEIIWPQGFQIVLWRGHKPASPPATRAAPQIQIPLYHYHLNDHLHNSMFSVSPPLSRSGSGNLAMAVLSMQDPQNRHDAWHTAGTQRISVKWAHHHMGDVWIMNGLRSSKNTPKPTHSPTLLVSVGAHGGDLVFRFRRSRLWVLVLLLWSCETEGKWLYLSEPPFPRL